MEENYNSDPGMSKTPKTSSTDGNSSSKTSGDSQVQGGDGVVDHEVERPYEKGDDQQEYIEQANNNTEVANESPVKDGKSMTMSSKVDNDETDNEVGSFGDTVRGDDPNETINKIPVM